MSDLFTPVIFLSSGNEKEISQKLKIKALESVLENPFELYFEDNGKPRVKYEKSVGISVSHDSGTVAVLVTPFEPVGIDIEEIKDTYPSRVADRFFCKNEKNMINNSEDFFKIWCKKESFVKMTGEGIAGISNFDSTNTNVVFTDLSEKISNISGKNFAFFICSKKTFIPEIIII